MYSQINSPKVSQGKSILFTGSLAVALILLPVVAHALNPKKEAEFQTSLIKLAQNMNSLKEKLGIAFQPGKEVESGMEEIAWRTRDLQEQTQKLAELCKEYWKNESPILGILDQWKDHAKLIDEVMIYSPVAPDISDLWKRTKELAMEVRDYAEEMPSKEEWDKVLEEFGFDIVKVGRYDKKLPLREKVKTFVGGSQLDQWPFSDERMELDHRDFGEHWLVRFKLRPRSRVSLNLPLKLRFEYKFAIHHHDGVHETTYADLTGGTHDYILKNVGEDFSKRGKIIHWRASLILNEKVVAQKKSPMWTTVSE